MHQLLSALRLIPAAGRYFGAFFLFSVIILAVGPAVGVKFPYTMYLVIGLAVVCLILFAIGAMRRRGEKKKAKEFEGSLGLQGRQAGVGKEEVREALTELSQRWEQAVTELRGSGVAIYDLPWFLLIGEPQSGKSTTIQNSGLEFPVGTESLSGTGGTRNCDWWFTNEAVILDTAGRFTFQEAAAPDQHEWNAFLKLIAKHRRQCPINGVIVVIPATSLEEDPVDVREKKAKNIRQKLQHLQKALSIRFPVTVLVTKTDRVLGFTEFFSRLEPADQRQLFGWSSRAGQDEAWDAKGFDRAFDDIVTRVHKMRLRFFHGEDNTARIDALFVLPEELAALKEPLAQYLGVIFAASRYEEPINLRGFYFTSGIQQGRPIAQACRDLLRVQAGDPHGVLEDLEQVFRKSRAFFIRDFYERKLFPEQGLISLTREAVQRETRKRRILFGVAVPLAIVFAVAFVLAGATLKSTVAAMQETVEESRSCLDDPACGVATAWDLIEDIELQRTRLTRERWALLMFGRGRNNAVNAEYLPAVQAELFRLRILGPVLSSFEARAKGVDWAESFALYPTFAGALTKSMWFALYDEARRDPDREREVRRQLGVKDLIQFCAKTPGLDASASGKAVDAWLKDKPNAAERADATYFKPILGLTKRIAKVDDGAFPTQGLAAVRRYWTVASLAGWDWKLIEVYLTGFVDSLRTLDGLAGASRRAYLDEFLRVATGLNESFAAGTRHMEAGRPTAEGDRPGPDPSGWPAACVAELTELVQISPELYATALDVEAHCARIPRDLAQLGERKRAFADLVVESRVENREVIHWAPGAEAVGRRLAELTRGMDQATIASQAAAFEGSVRAATGRSGALKEVSGFYQQAGARLAPVAGGDDLAAFPDLARATKLAGEVAVAEQVVPAIRTYFVDDVFAGGDCTDCFTAEWAEDNVTAANDFLAWATDMLEDAARTHQTPDELDDLNRALYAYLTRFVDREAAAAGGGSASSIRYNPPTKAARATRWAEFASEVGSWKPTSTSGGGGRGGSGGLTVAILRGFEKNNSSLSGLADRLASRSASRGGGGSSENPLSPALEKAVASFKDSVSSLPDEALAAWRELAGNAKALGDFHAFSAPALRRGDRTADELLADLEKHGAELMADEIRPLFEADFRDFWEDVDRCCSGAYPFVTARELDALADELRSGSRRSDGDDGGRDSRRRRDRDERAPRASLSWSEVKNTSTRELTWTLTLDTVDERDLGDVLADAAELAKKYAVEPIVEGREKDVDFVGPAKEQLAILGEWQRFMADRGGRGKKESMLVSLQRGTDSRSAVFLGERVSEVLFLSRERIRPSGSAGNEIEVPFDLSGEDLEIIGRDEQTVGSEGWTGRLVLKGGPLKLPFFVQLASAAAPSDRRKWSIVVELPNYLRSDERLEGIFDLDFERPLPRAFPELKAR